MKEKNWPTISVVMPCYNNEAYVAQAIESVVNQVFSNWELIVVNDGSTDNSGEVIEKYCLKDKRIRYVKQDNGGVSVARNRGVKEAKGEYICFLDADDRIAPNHLSLLMQGVSQETDIVYGGIIQRHIDENGKITDNHHVLPDSITDALLDNDNISAPYNVLVRSTLLEDIRFNENYTYGEDAVFKLQLINKAKSISLIPLTGYYYVRNTNFCSAVDRYHERMEEAINKKFELLEGVLDKMGMDKSLIASTIHKMYYDVALVPILTNPFHIGTPLSIGGKYKRIADDFFSEALPAIVFQEFNDKNDYNPFCRLLRYGKKLHSCLLVTVVLELFYCYKYKINLH